MMTIPILAVPSQSLNVSLAGQNCKINLYQKTTGVFVDMYVNNEPVIVGSIMVDRVNVIRQEYLGFIGGLTMVDTQGVSDASYDGFGSRWLLLYLEAGDL